jgi:HEAT repeat protein
MPFVKKPPASPPEKELGRQELMALLNSGSADQRSLAARSLGKFIDSAQALGVALSRENQKGVREAILISLAAIDTQASFDAVMPLLRSGDAKLRSGALDTLKAMSVTGASRLGELLNDADPDIRILACELARDMTSNEAQRALRAAIETDPLVNVCAAAIDALAEIGSQDDLPLFERCLKRFPNESFLAFSVSVARTRLVPPRAQ